MILDEAHSEALNDAPNVPTEAQRHAEKLRYESEFGPDLLDIIIVNPHRHGTGRVGYKCLFGGPETDGGGETLAEFAQRAFGYVPLFQPISKVRIAALRWGRSL